MCLDTSLDGPGFDKSNQNEQKSNERKGAAEAVNILEAKRVKL